MLKLLNVNFLHLEVVGPLGLPFYQPFFRACGIQSVHRTYYMSSVSMMSGFPLCKECLACKVLDNMFEVKGVY